MTPLLLAWQLAQPVDPGELRPLYEAAVARRGSTQAMRDLALFLLRQRDFAGAAEWLRRVVAAEETGADLEALGDALAGAGRKEEAAAAYERAGSPDALAKLAGMLQKEQAIAIYRKALSLQEKATGPNDAKVAVRLNDVALLTREEALFRRALAIQEKVYGPRHPEVATTLNNLASLLLETNRLVEAEAAARRALSILDATLGPRNVRTGVGASNLADVLMARRRLVAARGLYQRAMLIFEEALGAQHPWTREAKEAVEHAR
ncbi:MAG: tetratricopeptide repeat protein [Bryobacteraceae bacterium]|nr:tetratricopeptide repeat protein [Bryobacteraceae bacterium]